MRVKDQLLVAPSGHTTVTDIPRSWAAATVSPVPPLPSAGAPSHTTTIASTVFTDVLAGCRVRVAVGGLERHHRDRRGFSDEVSELGRVVRLHRSGAQSFAEALVWWL
jgi:hypothetical protein